MLDLTCQDKKIPDFSGCFMLPGPAITAEESNIFLFPTWVKVSRSWAIFRYDFILNIKKIFSEWYQI